MYNLAGNHIRPCGTFDRSNIPPALTTTTYNANNQQKVFGSTTEDYDPNGKLLTTIEESVTFKPVRIL